MSAESAGPVADRALLERVDSLVTGGYVGAERAEESAVAVPAARQRVLDWLRITSAEGDWRRFERLAVLALHVHPEGLGPILATVLATRPAGVNTEDLVDLLGELRAPEGVEPVATLVRERKSTDGPYFAFCVKALQALGEIGTPEAVRFLRGIATGDPAAWPDPLRWHAAEELGIEDELGFDEDRMLGGS
ncbi:HEAT repeat domain-containing protein [Streptomyces hyaluromycini]|uniref:HEAT repeat domain-containing protein n=1 Tax=Streptomyces hyaluromycini TaxID=1377993 RepID=UPI0011AEA0A6|nr:HEAT repeat domain-containing protein [Streptomyces hyaluromycini]